MRTVKDPRRHAVISKAALHRLIDLADQHLQTVRDGGDLVSVWDYKAITAADEALDSNSVRRFYRATDQGTER